MSPRHDRKQLLAERADDTDPNIGNREFVARRGAAARDLDDARRRLDAAWLELRRATDSVATDFEHVHQRVYGGRAG